MVFSDFCLGLLKNSIGKIEKLPLQNELAILETFEVFTPFAIKKC